MFQIDPPHPPQKILPTMYDLKSEDPEEPGLPDQFHIWQPRLLEDTFQPPNYPNDEIFIAADLNLYYDPNHTLWYKRPDWFAVLGVPRLYQGRDLRLSYVIWQEGLAPSVVVELLSPGTEKEDLGQGLRDVNQPPTKWEVYEQILRIPYYIVFDRYTDELNVWQNVAGRYQGMTVDNNRVWLPELGLGIGLWLGNYQHIERLWLRWYDAGGNWVLTPQENAEREGMKEKEKAERLAKKLRELGVNPDDM